MKRLCALLTLLVVLAAGSAIAPAPVMAGPLDAPKAAGQVGERPDGYAGIVKSAPANVRSLVQDINAKRRAQYARIAAKQNIAVEDVAALAGAKAIRRAKPGTYVMDASGAWVRK